MAGRCTVSRSDRYARAKTRRSASFLHDPAAMKSVSIEYEQIACLKLHRHRISDEFDIDVVRYIRNRTAWTIDSQPITASQCVPWQYSNAPFFARRVTQIEPRTSKM